MAAASTSAHGVRESALRDDATAVSVGTATLPNQERLDDAAFDSFDFQTPIKVLPGRIHRRIDIPVPAAGRVARSQAFPGLIWAVFDEHGAELVVLSSGLDLSRLGKSANTMRTYATHILRWARFCWAQGINPETPSQDDVYAYYLWLLECVRRHSSGEPREAPLKQPTGEKTRGQFKPGRDVTQPVKPSTARSALAAIRSIFNAMAFHRIVERSPVPPAAGVLANKGTNPMTSTSWSPSTGAIQGAVRGGALKPIPADDFNPHMVTPDQQRVLTSAPRLRNRFAWTFGLASGPRISEILSVTVGEIINRRDVVTVRTKGGGTRRVVMTPDVYDIADAYLVELKDQGIHLRDDEPLLRNLRDPSKPATYAALRSAMRRELEAAGQPVTHPHAMRHTAATRMLTAGMEIVLVSTALGHAHVTTTQLYLHPVERDAHEAAMSTWLTPPTPKPVPDSPEQRSAATRLSNAL